MRAILVGQERKSGANVTDIAYVAQPSNWNGDTLTISVPGITSETSGSISFDPTVLPEELKNYYAATGGLYIGAQTNDQLVIKSIKGSPNITIKFVIRIFEE